MTYGQALLRHYLGTFPLAALDARLEDGTRLELAGVRRRFPGRNGGGNGPVKPDGPPRVDLVFRAVPRPPGEQPAGPAAPAGAAAAPRAETCPHCEGEAHPPEGCPQRGLSGFDGTFDLPAGRPIRVREWGVPNAGEGV